MRFPIKRIFIAIVPDRKTIRSLSDSITEYQCESWAKNVNWVKSQNLHITLKFIGDVDDNRLNEIIDMIEKSLSEFEGFTVTTEKILIFPNRKKPHVIGVGLSNDKLVKLANRIENSLIKIGIKKEKRKFKGHITLGRFKNNFLFQDSVTDHIQTSVFYVKNVIVYKSVLKPDGPQYFIEKKVELKK
ncbi:MAG: RNA 2',3'-cyclic phosphodiesterase [Desulfobacterales bacterium]|nr:RNA 2',3'-cyclic phosphodiesterase [Desulfobacterales bacterium]MCP4159240.1 RNA 2',3'-cyclic phosphodiesterase [Deltaproteobacteria bacterium]